MTTPTTTTAAPLTPAMSTPSSATIETSRRSSETDRLLAQRCLSEAIDLVQVGGCGKQITSSAFGCLEARERLPDRVSAVQNGVRVVA